MSECRSCHAQVWWTMTDRGSRMLVDAEPSTKGNIRLEIDENGHVWAHVLSGARLLQARTEDEPLYLSHFATCPDDKMWRHR